MSANGSRRTHRFPNEKSSLDQFFSLFLSAVGVRYCFDEMDDGPRIQRYPLPLIFRFIFTINSLIFRQFFQKSMSKPTLINPCPRPVSVPLPRSLLLRAVRTMFSC